MRSSTLSPFIALIALATAATLAPNLPNGFYQAYTDENGIEYHNQITSTTAKDTESLSWTYIPRGPLANTSLSSASDPFSQTHNLEKRCSGVPNGPTWCGCHNPVKHANCDAAVANLKAQVGSAGIHPVVGNNYYWIQGSVVAFICAKKDTDWPIAVTSQVVSDAASYITKACGWYVAGTFMPAEAGVYSWFGVGYMQYSSGLDFCANQFGSGSSCC
jgi:hypothetical protein